MSGLKYTLCLVVLVSFNFLQAAEDAPTADKPGATTKPSEEKSKGSYFYIPIKGVIGKDFTAKQMESLLKQAKEKKANVILLEIDTPGGAVPDMERIVNLIIKNKGLRYMAFVRQALSAGAAITLTCPDIYVTETASIGAATSYWTDSKGRIVELPDEVEEKYRSVTRSVIRRAAQHGGHSSLLAEAMADRDFELTMKEKDGKVIFDRNGDGNVLAAKGRLLTLTAKEAVKCRLAKKVIQEKLGIVELKGMKSLTGGAGVGKDRPQTVCDVLAEKVEELWPRGGEDKSRTKIQRENAIEQWEMWYGRINRRYFRKKVFWALYLEFAKDDFKHYLLVKATYPGNQNVHIWGKVSRKYKDYLTKVQKGEVFYISGTIQKAHPKLKKYYYGPLSNLKTGRRLIGGYPLTIYLKNCEAGEHVKKQLEARRKHRERIKKLRSAKAKKKNELTDEQKAQKELKLAEMYRANGMTNKAREILGRIISDYPDTKAAKEAKEWFQEINKQGK